MKYDRKALAKATQDAIDAHRQWHDKENERYAKEHAEALTKWQERAAEPWKAAARTIQRKLRNGQPIVASDLPATPYGHSVDYFSHTLRTVEFQPPATLASLQRILEAVADDVVTSTSLTEMGVDRDALRSALSHMAPGSVWR